jgi:hypothetical protein
VVQGLHKSLLLRGAVLGGWPDLGEKTRRGAAGGLADAMLMAQGDGGNGDPSAVVVGGGRGGMCWAARRRGVGGGAMVEGGAVMGGARGCGGR